MLIDLNVVQLFVAMCIGHYWSDWSLQNNFVGMGKNRLLPQFNKDLGIPWYHMMIAHCAIHAGVFWIISGSFMVCILEFVTHFIIDVLKCEKKIGIVTDQALHLIMKAVYVYILLGS